MDGWRCPGVPQNDGVPDYLGDHLKVSDIEVIAPPMSVHTPTVNTIVVNGIVDALGDGVTPGARAGSETAQAPGRLGTTNNSELPPTPAVDG